MEEPQVKTAIVGMAGSGKTVLTTVLAIRISQQADQGMFLTPVGENLRQTLKYVQKNWQTLQNGQWPPSTPAGEVANLKWNLITGSETATVRFADCVGQDIHAIFSSDSFNPDLFPENQRQLFSYLNSANILLILVNMEDLMGRGSSQALENALDLYQMIYVLSQETEVPRKIAVIFNQYDRFGGEGFYVLLPEATLSRAAEIADTIRQRIDFSETGESTPVPFCAPSRGKMFCSGKNRKLLLTWQLLTKIIK